MLNSFPNMETPPQMPTDNQKMPVALVYWGRLGAGAALMREMVEAFAKDERFELYASASLQSELPPRIAAERNLSIETFGGPVSLLLRTLLLPLTLRRLMARMKAANIRAIVTVMPHIWGLPLQYAARRAGIRTVLILHDAEPHPGERRPLFDWLVRREVRRADRVVTLSNFVADRSIALNDIREFRAIRLYHPIFAFACEGKGRTAPASPFRLLFFGRILPYKGVGILLEAFAILRATGVDCELRIVGRGEIDAPGEVMAQPGLTIERGWVDPAAIAAILSWADAMVLPYLEASQSGVIAAAYGAHLPVVATPVGGLTEQVADGRTGLLAKGATAKDIADAIRKLIETPGLYAACRNGVADYAATRMPGDFVRLLGDRIAGIL
jgi:glycosyltransferase involved in cell wall biosynthesis